jgi:hypothetical protein
MYCALGAWGDENAGILLKLLAFAYKGSLSGWGDILLKINGSASVDTSDLAIAEATRQGLRPLLKAATARGEDGPSVSTNSYIGSLVIRCGRWSGHWVPRNHVPR